MKNIAPASVPCPQLASCTSECRRGKYSALGERDSSCRYTLPSSGLVHVRVSANKMTQAVGERKMLPCPDLSEAEFAFSRQGPDQGGLAEEEEQHAAGHALRQG